MKRLAIFASGGGSNAKALFEYFKDNEQIQLPLVIANKEGAGVFGVAASFGATAIWVKKSQLNNPDFLLPLLQQHRIDGILLAGFLLLIPPYLVAAYPKAILNIHPALLPKFGGAGMHGHHVHEAVLAAGETVSGPTVHLVNEQYDEGRILAQQTVPVLPDDTAETLARRVLEAEHQLYPKTVAAYFLR